VRTGASLESALVNDQLRALIEEAERQSTEVSAILAGIDQDRFARRPAENRWSAGEQIAHVPITDRPYLAVIAAALAAGEPARPDQRFRGGKVGNWFAGMMEPPPKRRMKTPVKLEPPPALDRDAVIRDFAACRAEMVETLRSADGVDLDRCTIRSPFLWLLKMPVFSACQVLLAHGRRHIWLARETLETISREGA
jgi:hypothetical protein